MVACPKLSDQLALRAKIIGRSPDFRAGGAAGCGAGRRFMSAAPTPASTVGAAGIGTVARCDLTHD